MSMSISVTYAYKTKLFIQAVSITTIYLGGRSTNTMQSVSLCVSLRGLPLSTYAPKGGGWGEASYTIPLRITCKKGVGGSR